jgi:predicted Na+-dependent transporter
MFIIKQRKLLTNVLETFASNVLGVIQTPCVTTLALGSRPRQRGCKGAGQEEARESHHILLGV